MLPVLKELEVDLLVHREAKNLQPQVDLLRETMKAIESDQNPPSLRPLGSGD